MGLPRCVLPTSATKVVRLRCSHHTKTSTGFLSSEHRALSSECGCVSLSVKPWCLLPLSSGLTHYCVENSLIFSFSLLQFWIAECRETYSFPLGYQTRTIDKNGEKNEIHFFVKVSIVKVTQLWYEWQSDLWVLPCPYEMTIVLSLKCTIWADHGMRMLPRRFKCSLRDRVQTPSFANLANVINLAKSLTYLCFFSEIWNIWTTYYLAQKAILGVRSVNNPPIYLTNMYWRVV